MIHQSLELTAPPSKKNVSLKEWKYEAPPAIISSAISSPALPTHPDIEIPKRLPKSKISEDCSLSDLCTPQSATTSQPPVYDVNAP